LTEGARFPAAIAAVPELTDEQRLDAIRAVELQRQRDGLEYADVRDVLDALGLVDLSPPLPSELARSCPTCGAAAGARCIGTHNTTLQVTHAARRQVKEQS